MNGAHVLPRSSRSGGDDPPVPATRAAPFRRSRPGAAQGIGLWVFIGVATTLFLLFLVAYVMRMSERDATAIGMPAQLWLSTGLLLAGSLLLQRACAGGGQGVASQRLFLAGGACALVFIGSQGWAWAAMLGGQVSLSGNPAGSFFYLLTLMHGLHVAGGLVGWGIAWRSLQQAPAGADWRVVLCARYWHFLLVVWLLLFGALSFITPELAAAICGSR